MFCGWLVSDRVCAGGGVALGFEALIRHGCRDGGPEESDGARRARCRGESRV